MARQKCVMGAMLEQISPEVAVRNFQKIAKASTQMISTNVPQSEVDNFMGLALRAKSQKIATLSLVPPTINTADPDIDPGPADGAEAIDKSEGKQVALAAGSPDPGAGAGTDAGTKKRRRRRPRPPTPRR